MKKYNRADLLAFSVAGLLILVSIFLAYLPGQTKTLEENGIAHFSVFEDSQSILSGTTIHAANTQFTPVENSRLYKKRTPSAWWIKLTPLSTEPASKNNFIEISGASLELIDIYFPDGTKVEAGKIRPVSNLEIKSRIWYIPIPEAHDNSKPIYIRIKTNTLMWVPVRIISAEQLINKSTKENLLFGFFFGIILSVIVINIFSFVILRDSYFSIYLMYLTSLFIYHLRVHGFLYLIPMPFFVLEAILWLSLSGLGIFMMLFAKKFLNLRESYPVINIILNINIGFFILQTIAGIFVSNYIANQIAYITGAVVPLVIIVTTAFRYFSGHREVRYYLIAWCAMFTGTFIWSATAYIEAQISANYFFLIGTSIDSLLFTLAIFDKINMELSEKKLMKAREEYYKDQARTDPLTGLYNRRYLDEKVRTMGNCGNSFEKTSLMIIDLDHFKEVNDSYGHLSGDLLLAKMGTKIQKFIRKSDIACRYGGDEFVILLPGADLSVALSIAQALHSSIKNDIFYTESGEQISYGVSIGVSEIRADDTFDGLFLRADAALYQSKRLGRNRISSL